MSVSQAISLSHIVQWVKSNLSHQSTAPHAMTEHFWFHTCAFGLTWFNFLSVARTLLRKPDHLAILVIKPQLQALAAPGDALHL